MSLLSQENIDLLISIYETEKNISEISRMTGMHKITIVKYLKNAGIYKSNKRVLSDIERDQILEIYNKGIGCKSISKNLGIPLDMIYNFLEREKVTRPPYRISEEIKQACIYDYLNNMRTGDICIKYGISDRFLWKLCKERSIIRPKRIVKCGSENHRWIDRCNVNCSYCGTEVVREKHRVDSRTGIFYCSQECRKLWIMENTTGKNNPNYKGGSSYGEYCEKFNAFFKRRVRTYMGNVCILCGKTKEENRNRNMDVHHVYGNKRVCCNDDIDFGYDKFATLCVSCHSKVRNSEEYRNILLNIINTKYGGKCYYTREEWKDMHIKKIKSISSS